MKKYADSNAFFIFWVCLQTRINLPDTDSKQEKRISVCLIEKCFIFTKKFTISS